MSGFCTIPDFQFKKGERANLQVYSYHWNKIYLLGMDAILSIQHGILLRVKHVSLWHQVCTLLKETVLEEGRSLKDIFL